MKLHNSLPKDEQFFEAYASLTPTLNKLGYLAQVVSALTEFGIIYALVKGSLEEFFPHLAGLAGIFGAIVGTAFLEVGLRKFIPYSVRAILYKRFTGLHRYVSGFIFAVCLGLLASSGILSFKGSFDLVEAVTPPPAKEGTTAIDSTAQAYKAEALKLWQADSLAIVQRFAPSLAAINTKYESLVNVEELALKRIQAREKAEGQSYGSQKANIRANIAALEARKAEELAAQEGSKAQALEEALAAKSNALAGIEQQRAKGRQEVEQGNAQAQQKAQTKVKRYGGGLAWFTVVCLLVLILAVAIDEIHKKGSGIEETAIPNQYYFSQGIFAEFLEMVSDKWNQKARAWIQRHAQRTPPPPEPQQPHPLYEVEALKPKRIKPKLEEGEEGQAQGSPGNTPQQQPPNEYAEILERLLGQNGHHNGNGNGHHNGHLSNSGRPIIQGFARGQNFSNPQPPAPTHSAIRYIAQSAIQPEAEVIKEVVTVEVDKNSRPCLVCGKMYVPRVPHQKYCSRDTCAPKAWAARHNGQEFDLGKYQKAQGRKKRK